MKAFLSYLFISLVLLQTFSRELFIVDFTLHRAAITARFCVNKSRPLLHCNGRCYFAKQLKQQQERESKLPNPLKERLEMLPLGWLCLLPPRLAIYRVAAVRYHQPPAPHVRSLGLRAIFRPPQGVS